MPLPPEEGNCPLKEPALCGGLDKDEMLPLSRGGDRESESRPGEPWLELFEEEDAEMDELRESEGGCGEKAGELKDVGGAEPLE
jgi:hypothetical protein